MKFKVNKSSHFQLLIFNFQLLLLLASCGPHDTTPDGLQPVTFTATVDGLARGTTENNWKNLVDRTIAVEIDGVVKKYTVADDGSLTPADAANTFYWKNRQITVSAWYPYAATKPDMIVQPDQSGDGYEKSDLLEAVPSMLTFGEKTILDFTHRAARVTVTLAAGDDIADVSGASGVLFMNLPGVSDGTTVAPRVTTDAGGTRTYSVLLAPGTIGGPGKAFLRVVLDGNTYYYTPDETRLAAGIQYNYDITVSKTGLTLASSSISAWTDGDGVIGQITEMTAVDLSAADATISDNGTYYVTGDYSGRKLTINGSPTLYLINAKLTCNGDSPITITSGSPTIVLVGMNVLTSYDGSALFPWSGATITLQGNGALTATGGGWAAGIGGGHKKSAGSIIIKSGTITATGHMFAAGIGSGDGDGCGVITILGGKVSATGGNSGAGIGSGLNGKCTAIMLSGGEVSTTSKYDGAGIGSGEGGSCGTITISGGNITAMGSQNAAGIGNGWGGSCGAIIISGGNVMAKTSGEYAAAAIGNGVGGKGCESVTLENCVIRVPALNGSGTLNGIWANGPVTPELTPDALEAAGVELYVDGKLYK